MKTVVYKAAKWEKKLVQFFSTPSQDPSFVKAAETLCPPPYSVWLNFNCVLTT